jgi:O-antigen ligase
VNYAAWPAALFLATVVFSHTVALRGSLLFIALCFAVAASAHGRRALLIAPPIWLPFAGWALWAGLSLAWSIERERSIDEFRNEICYSAAALWVCYVGAQARNAVPIFLGCLGAGAVLACGLAFYDFSQGLLLQRDGWHGGPGGLSSKVLVLMPCALLAGWYASATRSSWRLQSAVYLMVALLLLAAYTTLNRTVWLALAAEFALIMLMVARRPGMAGDVRKRIVGVCLLFSVLAGGVAMSWHVHDERFGADAVQDLKSDPRLAMWPEALTKVAEEPLFGYGFGRGLLRAALREEVQMPVAWHSHNLLVDMALQLGLPGLALFLLLLGSTLREGWRMASRADTGVAACGIALVAIVVGMVMRNLTDVLWVRHNALLYWGVVGMLLAWGGSRSRASSERLQPELS